MKKSILFCMLVFNCFTSYAYSLLIPDTIDDNSYISGTVNSSFNLNEYLSQDMYNKPYSISSAMIEFKIFNDQNDPISLIRPSYEGWWVISTEYTAPIFPSIDAYSFTHFTRRINTQYLPELETCRFIYLNQTYDCGSVYKDDFSIPPSLTLDHISEYTISGPQVQTIDQFGNIIMVPSIIHVTEDYYNENYGVSYTNFWGYYYHRIYLSSSEQLNYLSSNGILNFSINGINGSDFILEYAKLFIEIQPNPSSVPEPLTLWLYGIGFLSFFGFKKIY